MRRYPPIADHGLIGDLHTAALISCDGVLDWFCAPRFDSPSLFASLLDHDRGGYFAITPAAEGATTRQLYLADTAILVTRFMTEEGVGEVVDFMPLGDAACPEDRHSVIRVMRVTRGEVRFRLDCRPRFDYARATHRLDVEQGAARFTAPDSAVHLHVAAPGGRVELRAEGGDVRADLALRQGQRAAAVLTVCDDPGAQPPPQPTESEVRHAFRSTYDHWHRWVRRSRYRGRWQQVVNRSAITLKLMTYAPTGAPVAAVTAGLPEHLGSERNWDYRYTWIRDASLSVKALLDLGYEEEADAFRRWLGARVAAGATVTGEPLQIMYRVDGDPHLTEEVLGHLEGYRGSAPVRAGNDAAGQLQLDIYGEVAYALSHARDPAQLAGYDGWRNLRALLDWLARTWDRPDEGIWETRGGRRHFTFSRLMCWAAFDRGIRLARELARPADVAGWTAARDAVFEQVMERGWSTRRQAFVQHYDSEVLDASLLLMPVVGFLSPKDRRWLSTLDAMEAELVSDSLVHRYDPVASPDGLRGDEGTFSLCSFLYAGALARAGRLGMAQYAFDKMLTYANHVGLFAEEIGPAGEQLGNFPQAFTHVALIMAALALDEELDRAGD
ncbi:glucoamylase [Streptomyces agglomeratus]|uniref:Glucoamylase n=1 Tax=Streptomyces agglomeratus TaxID=285458 RepID=A0A1E5PG71_9ACTN|nr:glycoside hydrolase family 15 protein [Streptomyces agglomeratus]OEJ28558.1 glucoamylase [Streptomyces agglomeratus]OEJ37380.1 glucoamylase [Streptomyces agglomeratus]OEJ48237.1 glucoamylase [Streptomyces agglomeratus]